MEIQRTREREVHQERFTSLDREIEHAATEGRTGPEPALLVRRLKRLENLGLAEKVAPTGWVLAEDWQRRLRELGERGDILKQMHCALHGGDGGRFHAVRCGQGLPDGQASRSDPSSGASSARAWATSSADGPSTRWSRRPQATPTT